MRRATQAEQQQKVRTRLVEWPLRPAAAERQFGVKAKVGVGALVGRRPRFPGDGEDVLDEGAVFFVGMVLGALSSIAAANQISSLLFGVSPHDPVVLVGAVLVLGLTALAASWFPAVRGSRVDPMTTLRSE